MTSRILYCLIVLAGLPAAALAHPGHVADAGYGHTHWLAVAAVAGAAVVGATTWLRRRADRRIRDRKL